MTKLQAKTVEKIKEWVLEKDCLDNNQEYEFKQFDIFEIKGLVWVYCVSGRKGDENTMFLIDYRIRRKIAIGSRGGVTAYVFNYKRIRNKIFRGWRKAMTSGYDQSRLPLNTNIQTQGNL